MLAFVSMSTFNRHNYVEIRKNSGEATLTITLLSFWSEVYSKGKEVTPFGSNFFLFRVDPFSERD